jgi:hypothetical protein
MLRALLLFAVLFSSALAVHERVHAGTGPNSLQSTASVPEVIGGLDPNG